MSELRSKFLALPGGRYVNYNQITEIRLGRNEIGLAVCTITYSDGGTESFNKQEDVSMVSSQIAPKE